MIFRLVSHKIRMGDFYIVKSSQKKYFSFLEAVNLIMWPFAKRSIKSSMRPSVHVISRHTKRMIAGSDVYVVYEKGSKPINCDKYLPLYPFIISPLKNMVALGFANAVLLDIVGCEQGLDPKNFVLDVFDKRQNSINVRYNIAFLALRRLR